MPLEANGCPNMLHAVRVRAAVEKFVGALVADDPAVIPILVDDPAGMLVAFGVGEALARSVVRDVAWSFSGIASGEPGGRAAS